MTPKQPYNIIIVEGGSYHFKVLQHFKHLFEYFLLNPIRKIMGYYNDLSDCKNCYLANRRIHSD